jgi:hypothetical protein
MVWGPNAPLQSSEPVFSLPAIVRRQSQQENDTPASPLYHSSRSVSSLRQGPLWPFQLSRVDLLLSQDHRPFAAPRANTSICSIIIVNVRLSRSRRGCSRGWSSNLRFATVCLGEVFWSFLQVILRLCLLPSLRSRTRTLTLICSKRLARFEQMNWTMLALMNWCTTSVVKLHLRKRPLVPSPVASSSRLLFGMSGSPRNGYSSTLIRSRKSLAHLALPHLVPRCCVPIGTISLSRVGLVQLACAVMDPSAPPQSFASPKYMRRASISHACACYLLCLLPWASS